MLRPLAPLRPIALTIDASGPIGNLRFGFVADCRVQSRIVELPLGNLLRFQSPFTRFLVSRFVHEYCPF